MRHPDASRECGRRSRHSRSARRSEPADLSSPVCCASSYPRRFVSCWQRALAAWVRRAAWLRYSCNTPRRPPPRHGYTLHHEVNAMTTDNAPHILAIDDDPAMRELIADYLGENDVRVTTVATGEEMARVLDEQAIDAIVLDLRLADEDGMELAKKLRAESTIPIIMVTGKKDEADRVMGLELGADDYITKPFSPRELLARVRAVLRRYKIL